LPENKDAPIVGAKYERRTETRLFTNAHVEIAGVDLAGNTFMEVTRIKNFSDVGCQFQTQIPLRRGTVVEIRPLDPTGQRMPQEPSKSFEIVWTTRCVPGWLAGARVSRGETISRTDYSREEPKREG